MKKYETLKLEVFIIEDEDVLSVSPTFEDDTTGDNGVYFPGGEDDNGGIW